MAADWSGRAALITDAASGIGRASAIAFAAAGASVALVDIDAGSLADTAKAASRGHEGLVSMVEAFIESCGRVVLAGGDDDRADGDVPVPAQPAAASVAAAISAAQNPVRRHRSRGPDAAGANRLPVMVTCSSPRAPRATSRSHPPTPAIRLACR